MTESEYRRWENRTGQRESWKPSRRLLIVSGVLIAVVVVLIGVRLLLFPRPRITLNGSKTVTLEVFEDYEEPGATVKLRRRDITDEMKVIGEVRTDIPGDYEVSYEVEVRNKTYSRSRKIQVRDTEPPVLELVDGDRELNASSLDTWEDPGYTAYDNFDGSLTSMVDVILTENKNDTFTVTYKVWDQAENTAEAERIVEIRDTTPPDIVLNGDAELTIQVGTLYEEEGASAVDDLDGDVTQSLEVSGTVDGKTAGTYTVTYTATDAAGNVGTAERTVLVKTVREIENEGVIYLTFDDGPSSETTEKILDILEKNEIQATFFILDYGEEEVPLLQRMVEDGDTIGIHALDHDYEVCYGTENAYLDGVYTMIDRVKEDTGYEPFCVRFPGGSSNTISENYNAGIMTRLVEKVEAAGLEYYDWNVDSEDASGNGIDAETLAENVTEGLQTGRGNIVLCHDTNAKATTAQALQSIIDYGKENGYSFSAIQEDTTPVHHTVNN